MLPNDLPLPVGKFVLLLRIAQRDARMPESMQPLALRNLCLVMPVIEKIIVQQSASDQIVLVAAQPELFIQQKTVPGHIHDMAVYRHIAVLDMPPRPLEIFRIQNVRTMLPQQRTEPFLPLVQSLNTLSSLLSPFVKKVHTKYPSFQACLILHEPSYSFPVFSISVCSCAALCAQVCPALARRYPSSAICCIRSGSVSSCPAISGSFSISFRE